MICHKYVAKQGPGPDLPIGEPEGAVTRFPTSPCPPNGEVCIWANPQGELQPGPYPVVHLAEDGSLQGATGQGRGGGWGRTRECRWGQEERERHGRWTWGPHVSRLPGPSSSDGGIPALFLAHSAFLSPSPLPRLPAAPFPCCAPLQGAHGAVTMPLSPQDFLRCVTAALIYFAISITAVAKYSDGASKAAGVSSHSTPGRGRCPVMPHSSSPHS